MKRFFIVILTLCFVCMTNAQFPSDDRVYFYLPVDKSITDLNAHITKIAFSYGEVTEASEHIFIVKKEIAKNPKLLRDKEWATRGTRSRVKVYNASMSNSKRIVYTCDFKGEYDSHWGKIEPYIKHMAFTRDKKQMIVWFEGEEDQRQYFILVDESELLPNTDFLND